MRKISLALVLVLALSFVLSGCTDNATSGQKNILLEESDDKTQENLPKKDYIILKDLEGADIGIVEGITTEEQVKEKIKNAKLVSFATAEEGAKALLDKKITALILDNKSAKTQFANDGRVLPMLQNLVDAEYKIATFVDDPVKDSDSFKMVIDETVGRLKRVGELDKLYAKYFGDELPDTSDFTYNEGIVEGRVLKVGVASDNAPFSYKDENGRYVGYDIEIANEVAKTYGATLEIKAYSRDELLSATQNGEVKMVMGKLTDADDADAKDWLLFSGEVYCSKTLHVMLNVADTGMQTVK